ncbi:hypothetical protein GCM10018772_66420 [Streptomyces fumanus]|uniref:Lipoprotein n=1 Tax=Streptomyces fumanus TaxID=67302 RepID=A0A919E9I5_9ACTN|nr:hypothetical protein GCM10018772_66420 [Streptomyces fumanus]
MQKPMKAMMTPVQAAGVWPWLLSAIACSSLLCTCLSRTLGLILAYARACREFGVRNAAPG